MTYDRGNTLHTKNNISGLTTENITWKQNKDGGKNKKSHDSYNIFFDWFSKGMLGINPFIAKSGQT